MVCAPFPEVIRSVCIRWEHCLFCDELLSTSHVMGGIYPLNFIYTYAEKEYFSLLPPCTWLNYGL